MSKARVSEPVQLIAKSPAARQAERRARGVKTITLSASIIARIDLIKARDGDATRVACLQRLVLDDRS